MACAQNGVKGITLITAGYGEVQEDWKAKESKLARLAQSNGMRLLGPNVSGTFNLHAGLNASAAPLPLMAHSTREKSAPGSGASPECQSHRPARSVPAGGRACHHGRRSPGVVHFAPGCGRWKFPATPGRFPGTSYGIVQYVFKGIVFGNVLPFLAGKGRFNRGYIRFVYFHWKISCIIYRHRDHITLGFFE